MKKKALLSSILVIVLCVSVIAGSTLALFTDESEFNIAATTGDVEITAYAGIQNVYSALATEDDKPENGDIYLKDENGHGYKHELQDKVDAQERRYFKNGGYAVVDGANIVIDRITPGDRVDVVINVDNKSDVAMSYRYIIVAEDTNLAHGMVVSVGDNTDSVGDPAHLVAYEGLKSWTSKWYPTIPVENENGNVTPKEVKDFVFSIELPVYAGDEYQSEKTAQQDGRPAGEQSLSYTVIVEAVQGNANHGDNYGPVVEFFADKANMVHNLQELQAAVNAATVGENLIVVADDIVGDLIVKQKEGVKLTIDGNGFKYAGSIVVDGGSSDYDVVGLTVRNFNFEADTLNYDAYINLGDKTDATRYVDSVTVQNCTFSGTGDVFVAVKSYTGSSRSFTFDNCVVNAGMHSALQLYPIDNYLKVTDCEIYSKNGISLTNTAKYLDISGTTMKTEGYCVRIRGIAGCKYSIVNSNLTSANDDNDAVIIFKAGTNYTVDLTGTTLTATNGIVYEGDTGINIIK